MAKGRLAPLFKGKVRDNITNYLGGGRHSTLKKEIEIVEAVKKNPATFQEILDKVDRKSLKVDKALNKIKRELRMEEARKLAIGTVSAPNKTRLFELKRGDMRELGKEIPDNSIDMIFTDPPYAKEFLYLADELGSLAQHALRPGKNLVVITPSVAESFEYYLDTLRKCGLKFVQYIALVHGGNTGRLHDNGIQVDHKPILWFFKPDPNFNRPIKYFDIRNVIYSEPPSKDLHEMEQSTVEAKYMINALTVEGETVVDPFTGSGTTGAATLELKRKFLGFEINPTHYSNALMRLSKYH